MKIVSWNINQKPEAWELLRWSNYDIALLQEAKQPPEDFLAASDISPGDWRTAGTARRDWRTAIVKLSDRVEVEWISTKPLDQASNEDLAVSRMGTIAGARVTQEGHKPVFLFSCYSIWENHYKSSEIFADASAHRIASDLSSFIARDHHILAAGDFNILNRYGEHGSEGWAKRYASVFGRFEAIGLPFAGPQSPDGRQADPWPDELPENSKDVPTYYHTRQKSPAGATRQLDFVFCSPQLNKHLKTAALNAVNDWGPSDHCRIDINLFEN
jgi:exonuclease III